MSQTDSEQGMKLSIWLDVANGRRLLKAAGFDQAEIDDMTPVAIAYTVISVGTTALKERAGE